MQIYTYVYHLPVAKKKATRDWIGCTSLNCTGKKTDKKRDKQHLVKVGFYILLRSTYDTRIICTFGWVVVCVYVFVCVLSSHLLDAKVYT